MLVEIIKLIIEVIAVAVAIHLFGSYIVARILNSLRIKADFEVRLRNIRTDKTMTMRLPFVPRKYDQIDLPLDEIRGEEDKDFFIWDVTRTVFTKDGNGDVIIEVLVKGAPF